MVIRQASPFPLGAKGRPPPSHLTVAIGLSIGAHVAIGLYVAFLKFSGPPPVIYPPDKIYQLPIVELPPPPQPDEPRKPPPQQPVIHESIPGPPPPIPPQEFAPPRELTPFPTGPVTSFDPGPQAAPAPPRDPIIRNPTWVRRPDAGDFARFYPERALRLGRQGEAEITCHVLASGQVAGCRVTGEAPDNMGFGQAALKLSRYLQIAPKTVDGRPVDGGILVVPIRFNLG